MLIHWFSKGIKIPSRLQDIPREELDQTLQLFYAEVQKAGGSDYEPESLHTMLATLDRHLHENGAKHSIVKDRDFEESRKLLNGKAIDLQQQGKGKRKKKAVVPMLESRGSAKMFLASVLVKLRKLGTGCNWHALSFSVCLVLACFSLISRLFSPQHLSLAVLQRFVGCTNGKCWGEKV